MLCLMNLPIYLYCDWLVALPLCGCCRNSTVRDDLSTLSSSTVPLSTLTIKMLLEIKKITVPPGQKILLHDISWSDFEAILEDLGEHRASRIAYDNGILEIMTPLPEHEVSKVLIGDLIKALLEELEIDFWSLGSTTFKNQLMAKGIEPDDCFYLKNEAAVRGKNRLDLTIDPPPDLAIEVEIISRSNLNIYEALKVPELWRFEQGKLEIYILQEGKYVKFPVSLTFANLPIIDLIPEYLTRAKNIGRNQTMKEFRNLIRKQISEKKV